MTTQEWTQRRLEIAANYQRTKQAATINYQEEVAALDKEYRDTKPPSVAERERAHKREQKRLTKARTLLERRDKKMVRLQTHETAARQHWVNLHGLWVMSLNGGDAGHQERLKLKTAQAKTALEQVQLEINLLESETL